MICKNGLKKGTNYSYNNPEYRKKMSLSHMGDKNPNWKGGIKKLCPDCGVVIRYSNRCRSCANRNRKGKYKWCKD